MKVLLVLAALVVAGHSWTKRYDGYQLLEMVPKTKFQLDFLQDMMLKREELDFWLEPTRLNKAVHVLVAPDDLAVFKYDVGLQGMSITVLRQNVQDHLDAEMERRSKKEQNKAYDYNDYNTYEDFMTEIDNMATNKCPADKLCTTEVIGQSFEGRDMKLMRITDDPVDVSKPWFWMDSCIHAREWLACATLMNVVNKMLTDNSTSEQLNSFNWIVLPIFNPDGYVYTLSDRYWRKSRNENEGSTCLGTDLNRNHAHDWNTGGSSDNPCSDTYHGSGPASEPEVSSAEDYALSLDRPIIAWLSFHTYGQYWLVPYGNCSSHWQWEADVQGCADATCTAIENTHDTSWDCGNSCIELYGTSGTTADWAMGAAGAKYSYTPELRGPGFDPPTSAIQPSFDEIWNGFVAKLQFIIATESY